MSDAIKHECGIAVLKLKKPLDYYVDKYGTAFYALNKMYLLMEKQHNRGQDGAGLANIKFDVEPGKRYISRKRSIDSQPIKAIFAHVNKKFKQVEKKHPERLKDAQWLKDNYGFTGELFLGHLRYGTFGKNSIESCHPFLRQNNWMTRNLVVAGNFNLTNVDELFKILVEIGQHPKEISDTVTVLEKIGHFLDEENQKLFNDLKSKDLSHQDISKEIAKSLNLENILKKSAADWDGGYAMAGMLGHGDAFVLRDPSGIRPAFYYQDDEIVVVTSERPVIQTAFNVPIGSIQELTPGHALIMKKEGDAYESKIREPYEKQSCSFERIYFSRGSDKDIYNERKELGRLVCPAIMDKINNDLDHSVFSFIPNTAETAFYGMIKGLEDQLDNVKAQKIAALGANPSIEAIEEVLSHRTRIEKIAIKDAKLRTFISSDSGRDDLVAHVYDITHGAVNEGDNLVVIDDSIVRGTTLKKSIIRILDRLKPGRIVVASSAPQIRYPDCYGIDMAKMGDFIAFQAAIALLKERGQEYIISETYEKCKAELQKPKEQMTNCVKAIYEPFSDDEISEKISALLKPEDCNAEVHIVYQTIADLHKACPNHKGDWYFSGNYPTPGGNKVVNKSFVNYIEGKNERAY